jgi:uncharacterized glyoxalase superfamily protein PhnB
VGIPDQAAGVVTSVVPIVAVRDLDEAIGWFRDAVGFEVVWRWGDPATRAGVARNGHEIQLVADGIGAPPGASRVYCQVRGVDWYRERCRAGGAEVEMELADRPFGMRDFRVVDPSGNVLCFGEPLPRES